MLLPEGKEGVYFKRAIVLRNRWMVEQADILIAMVRKEYGGAYTMLRYARKKGKLYEIWQKNEKAVGKLPPDKKIRNH